MLLNYTPRDAFAVTPDDSTQIRASSLYVGVAGNVAVVTEDGSTVTFVGVPAGAILPIRCTKVRSTSTTASSIVGFRG